MVDEEESSNDFYKYSGIVILFSFISIITIFALLIFLGATNNYALGKLLESLNQMVSSGALDSNWYDLAVQSSETYINFISYIDKVWLMAFISMVASSFVFSYHSKRQNYFGLFSFIVLGIIILTYVGSIFINLTSWFQTNVLIQVFPTFTNYMPIFSWYLSNIGIINLIIISIMILLNFVDLDLSKFSSRKNKDVIDEI